MKKLNIVKVGVTVESKGETVLIVDGDLPPNCIVVFMDKDSWKILKEEMPTEWRDAQGRTVMGVSLDG